ncbi:MAG: diguanylate cyclase domain-containing protein [Beduini sp.]|uniref:sensor domain-containing diguanylate cyclase n=1 Tax=Beduini sp. TaxID=1922300 RepID=UPI0011C83E87
MKKEVKSNYKKHEEIIHPLTSIRKIFIIFSLFCLLLITVGNSLLVLKTMHQVANTAYQSAESQISQKIEESLKLLESLSSLPEFYDPDIPWETKTEKLDKINESFDYMFICYVDKDIQVYTLGEEPASLASREHMQTLYSTKKSIVTDSFVAGADGKTLNYTVAVPLLREEEMTGSLFCSIYFDDIIELLSASASINGAEAVLIGSKGQVMSSTNQLSYGTNYIDIFEKVSLLQMTTDKLETSLLSRESGSYQSVKSGNFMYTVYGPVQRTNWDILVTVDFLALFYDQVPQLVCISCILLVIIYIVYYFVKKYIDRQAELTNKLVTSIQNMEKKLYSHRMFREMDYENILQMSSEGLKDGLTGTATRTFFLNQAEQILQDKTGGNKLTLCFIDLDNLKILNDTYGHQIGDVVLKKIGTILREYEKKYDGLVGRYGGDEFIIILQDIDSINELKEVLSEMLEKLAFKIEVNENVISVHSSIGACIWNEQDTLDMLITNADKALYDVKRHGKGNYSLFLNGESYEK